MKDIARPPTASKFFAVLSATDETLAVDCSFARCGWQEGGLVSAFQNALRIALLACGLALSAAWSAFLGFEVFRLVISFL